MALKKDKELHQVIVDGVDILVEEGNNTSINLRKVYWEDIKNPKEDPKAKFELRKYTINKDGDEVAGKGVTFLSEDGPDLLVETLIEAGFGRTENILRCVSKRPDAEEIVCLLKNEDETKQIGIDLLEVIQKNG